MAAGIADSSSLDALIEGGRHVARTRLGLATLEETGRVLSALERARQELNKQETPGQPA